MLTIYHVPRSRSVRVLWLCEELAVPYQVESVDFSPEYRASDEWRRMHPAGKVPVLTDDDFKLFESGAMVQYVLDRYGDGRLQPAAGTRAHAEYLQWSWFAEATFARPLGEIVNHRREFPGDNELPGAIDEMRIRAWTCVHALNGQLAGRPYLLGDAFSAADIMTGYTLMLMRWLAPGEFPANVDRYWETLDQRPAFTTARRIE